MAETVMNRGKLLLVTNNVTTLDLRMLGFIGTAVGTDDADLNTVADLDAVSGVSIHSERLTLSGVTATQDDANNRVNIDAANLTFAVAAGVTLAGVAIYVEGVSDAARQLIATYSTGFPESLDGGLLISVSDFLRGLTC